MREKKKQALSVMYIEAAKKVFIIATFLMLLFLIAGELFYPDERDAISKDYEVFDTKWERLREDGSREEVQVPGKVSAEYGEKVTLVTTLPKELQDGKSIFFYPIWQDVAIYINGELRQLYTTEDSRPFGKNSAFRYVYVDVSHADAGKELTYEFVSNSKYTGMMRKIYIGDKLSIWLSRIEESGLLTIIAVFLFVMSLFCILTCGILKWVYKKTLPLNYLAWTIFLCSTWILSEIEFRQLIMKNVSVLTSCTYWCLMIIPMPLIVYMDLLQDGRYRRLYMAPVGYTIVVLVAGTFLQLFEIVQFVEQIPMIHAGLIISIICIAMTVTIDLFRKRIYDYLVVAIGVYGMLLTVIVEMYLYYIGASRSLGTVLLMGLMFLLIMAIIKAGQDLFVSESKKQQAITAREAQAKFLANMSHEIRTPINAVIGMNEMILRENENAAVREYAQNIKSASNMLLGLVNDILDFTKIESGQLELVEEEYSLAAVLQDELLLLNARAAGKPLSTQIEIDPNVPSGFWGDELRIKQILTNLLSNAVKYTHEGMITLKVFYEWIDKTQVRLGFSVKDTGVGIKKENLAELFDSFKRLELSKNRNVEGTGLGLNIAKQLADLMNGSITVESIYGKGSTFTVMIPQRVTNAEPVGNLQESLKRERAQQKVADVVFTAPEARVLVVDDNAMNLSVIKGLLKRTNVQLDLAMSGKECIKLTKHKKYHIILMDHMMPEMDGVETLRCLRADNANPNQKTVIIALTANAIAGCREMYMQYGFHDYISKPIQAEKLETMLMKYLPKRLVRMADEQQTDYLHIDSSQGLSYSLGQAEIYQDVLQAFCDQCEEYLPKLEIYFNQEEWEQYAIIAHALKGNALNIGAAAFSKLSLSYEKAAKEQNGEFIRNKHTIYVQTLKELQKRVEKLIETQSYL